MQYKIFAVIVGSRNSGVVNCLCVVGSKYSLWRCLASIIQVMLAGEQEQMATGSVAAGAAGVKTDCCPLIRSCKGFSHFFSDPLNKNWACCYSSSMLRVSSDSFLFGGFFFSPLAVGKYFGFFLVCRYDRHNQHKPL